MVDTRKVLRKRDTRLGFKLDTRTAYEKQYSHAIFKEILAWVFQKTIVACTMENDTRISFKKPILA